MRAFRGSRAHVLKRKKYLRHRSGSRQYAKKYAHKIARKMPLVDCDGNEIDPYRTKQQYIQHLIIIQW